MARNVRDLLSGALFLSIAIFFFVGSLRQDLGTAQEMGPGYFPLLLSILLGAVGFFVGLRGWFVSSVPIGGFAIRGAVLVTLAPIVFALTVGGLGLVPSLLLSLLIAAFASRSMGVLRALLAAVALTAFCVLVFSYGIGLPYPLVGPWMR